MINRIYAYLATAAAILLALFGIHRSGKRQGREETEAEVKEQHHEALQETIRQDRVVERGRADPDGMRQRLSDRLRRK